MVRFEFGKNWTAFARTLSDAHVEAAQTSLIDMLGVSSLQGKRFLDIGCGSGLSGLAALRMGAEVHSFDADAESVLCTQHLKERYAPSAAWTIETGDILSPKYVATLGHFDVIYAWGVLHHTGNLRDALDRTCALVSPKGLLYVALYNDQGWLSRYWTVVKKAYHRLPRFLRPALTAIFALYFWMRHTLARIVAAVLTGARRTPDARGRGMNMFHDLRDWIGGYPFEVAKPEAVLELCRNWNLNLLRMKTCGGGHGCNEFLFTKADA